MGEAVITKVAEVRQAFEAPERYLHGTGFNIRIRQETVRSLVAGSRFDRILDIGCGNGTISLPLLRPDNRLLLLDVSSTMISIARSNVPAELAGNVQLLNANVMAAPLEPRAYDLIVCLGVLAHVDSPPATIAKIASLLRPGGSLILEFTDSFHPAGLLIVLYHRLLDAFRPSPYALNLLSHRDVFDMLKTSNLRLVSAYRYSLWLPGLHKLFSQNTLYKMVRAIFGTPQQNRNSFLGNQYICLVKG
ncbi:MAG TPA: class I SAM-dependent methyltransferase [Terriglobia bacterium]|nr:class I SAM-dependent methyltransferase [Terriglobia bacterium]